MKTTNYEISKQLAEAGFEDGYIYAWYFDLEGLPWIQEIQHAKNIAVNRHGEETRLTFAAPAYDLETILEALPNFIENGNGTGNCLVVDVAFGEIHYEGDCDNDAMFITTTEENESLADAAAKLWLKLKKEGLV